MRGRVSLLYGLFCLSGISGLVYQVVWVREFGHVFGNTVQSASLVIAIFMLGLGLGSYLMGRWADRRYALQPDSLLRVYASLEAAIAGLALAVALVLPHLSALVASLSAYSSGADGWNQLTVMSYVARAGVAVALVAPITLLMGGTLTILIRYLVRSDLSISGWTIALLYGANTGGAAAGAFLTDFAFVPEIGLFGTQVIAVVLNAGAALGAWWLAGQLEAAPEPSKKRSRKKKRAPTPEVTTLPVMPPPAPDPERGPVAWTSLALALSGFAVLGFEILWFRHATILLGGFRAVFSLVLTVLLLALALGALAGGWFDRRYRRPAETLMLVQALFVLTALAGIGSANVESLEAVTGGMGTLSPARRTVAELWFNLRPLMVEMGLPALLAGFAFPLGNAIVQRAEATVGRRAGMLYLANTAGAVAGSLVTGYLLLPLVGIQMAATVLAVAAAFAIVPIYVVHRDTAAFAWAGACALAALAVWTVLPADLVFRRAMVFPDPNVRVLAVSEGTNELIVVVDSDTFGMGLFTNGHAMSSTALLDQRYMRALAHIPLLSMSSPERVLVIGFGVGNTTHAATLHPSVREVDVADLSRHVLEHANYFRAANRDVLQHPKVSVFVNDGRQHLQMVDEGTYDLITLEPPPIAYAGVGALYSREFYQLARSRLAPSGYVSQWLPAYQVPGESSLAMVRAFIDVFPQTVLLSGSRAELMLLGTSAPGIAIDPARLNQQLIGLTEVREDLARVDLGTPREIVGTFVGSAATLARATSASLAMTDDRPLQEYGVRSQLRTGLTGIPASLFALDAITEWCPGCVIGADPAPVVANLDLYMGLSELAYTASAADVAAESGGGGPPRLVMGSTYLGSVVPDVAEAHDILGVLALREGRVAAAIAEFEAAIARNPAYENARLNLGGLYNDEGAELLDAQRVTEATDRFRAAVAVVPTFAEAYNNLGVALASQGLLAEAAAQFQRAVDLRPDFTEARENLARAQTALAP